MLKKYLSATANYASLVNNSWHYIKPKTRQENQKDSEFMQSSAKPTNDTQSKLLAFFKWCHLLLHAKSVQELQGIHDEMKVTTLESDIGKEDDYTNQLHAANIECNEALQLLYEVKLDQQNEQPKQSQFKDRFDQFNFTSQNEACKKYLLPHYMSIYIRIVIAVVSMETHNTELTDEKRQQVFMWAMKITTYIATLAHLVANINAETKKQMSAAEIKLLDSCSGALMLDGSANNVAEKCSLTIANILISKLLVIRNILELNEQKLANAAALLPGKVKRLEFLQYQQVCDHVTMLDSFIRRLNLIDHGMLRNKYNRQYQNNDKRSDGQPVLIFWDYMTARSMVYVHVYFTDYIRQLIDRIDRTESCVNAMITSKLSGIQPPQTLFTAMQHQLNNSYIKARLAYCHVLLLPRQRMNKETDTAHAKRLKLINSLIENCTLTLRVCYAMQALMDQYSDSAFKYTACMIEAADDLLLCNFSRMDLTNATSVSMASMMSQVLIQQARLMLQKDRLDIPQVYLEKRKMYRLQVYSYAVEMLAMLFASLGVNKDPSNMQYFTSAKVIMDTYFGLMKLCENQLEVAQLVRIKSAVMKISSVMPNQHQYEFMHVVMMTAIVNKHRIDSIGTDLFSCYSAEADEQASGCIISESQSLYQDIYFMVSADLKASYFSWIVMMLDYKLKQNKNVAAIKIVKQLFARALSEIKDFCSECNLTIIPEAIIEAPVRLLKYKPVEVVTPQASPQKSSSEPTPDSSKKKKKKKNKNKKKTKNISSTSKKTDVTPVSSTETTPTKYTPRTPGVDVEFKAVCDHFENDYIQITQFYQSRLVGYRHLPLVGHAFLGLARCLDLATDRTQARETLIKFLEDNENQIFELAEKSMPDKVKAIRDEYTQIMSRYIKIPEVVVLEQPQVVVTQPLQHEEEKIVEHKTLKRRSTRNVSRQLFFQPKPEEPAPRVISVLIPENEPSVYDKPFYQFPCEEKVDENFLFELNIYQRKLADLLISNKMFPLGQGAMGAEALVNIARRDTDILCFITDEQVLEKILNENQADLCITHFTKEGEKFNINFKLDPALPDLEIKLTLSYRIAHSAADIPSVLLRTAKGYGLSLIYVDLADMSLVDPLRQGRNIKVNHRLDIGAHFDADMDLLYSETPERIFDAAYRLSRFAKHNISFALTNRLAGTINSVTQKSGDHAKDIFGRRISIFRFDKLYLFGHGLQSNTILASEPFCCLDKLFPYLNDDAVNRDIFITLCLETDKKMQFVKSYNLTPEDLDNHRAQFFAELFVKILVAKHPAWNLDNTYDVYKSVGVYLTRTGFSFREELRKVIADHCHELFKALVNQHINRNSMKY